MKSHQWFNFFGHVFSHTVHFAIMHAHFYSFRNGMQLHLVFWHIKGETVAASTLLLLSYLIRGLRSERILAKIIAPGVETFISSFPGHDSPHMSGMLGEEYQ